MVVRWVVFAKNQVRSVVGCADAVSNQTYRLAEWVLVFVWYPAADGAVRHACVTPQLLLKWCPGVVPARGAASADAGMPCLPVAAGSACGSTPAHVAAVIVSSRPRVGARVVASSNPCMRVHRATRVCPRCALAANKTCDLARNGVHAGGLSPLFF